ncbi:MAG: nucleoid-associated protein [Bacteroidales bacterium]|nr:nucleoid-associated protein [Bacteroidales bacterium]
MMQFEDTQLIDLVLHRVGRKSEEEVISFSKTPLDLSGKLEFILLKYFLSSFKSEEYYNFYHESDIAMNEVFVYVSSVFENPGNIYEQSVNLAKHLYEKSVHPKIKSGEFYTAYFKNCAIGGITADAVGLFKSENKDTFLKVHSFNDGFELESDNGVNINKLDKGCLIFNVEKENGYIVAVVDNTNKGTDAQYWIDDFLHVRQRKDEYYNTSNVLTLCKNFVTNEFPQQFDVSKADQIDLLNKSVKFFREKDNFDMNDFTNEVIAQPEVIQSFNQYKQDYQKEQEIEFSDNFAISGSAVKKQSRVFKSVIKLDKNFHIYVHGNRALIEQGVDDIGRKFYKIYYEEES